MGQKKIIKKIIRKYGFELHTVRLNRPVRLKKKILRRINNNQPALSWNELRTYALKQRKLQWASVIESASPQSWSELQPLAKIVARHIHDHNVFERLLTQYDPKLSLPNMHKEEKIFIAKGAGAGSLQAYRKVVIDNVPCFEKIYLNESIGLQKSQWFYTSILPIFESSVVQAPKLLHVCRGEKMTVLYFEYLDVILPTKAEALDRIASLCGHFYDLDKKSYAVAPAILRNFWMSYGYSSGVAGIVRIFKRDKNKFDTFRLMEETVKDCRHCFCHGDLSINNLILPNHIIDLDECGIYPFGFDIAKVLVGYLNPVSAKEIQQYLESRFSGIVDGDEWNKFLFTACFFSFVFSCRDGKYSDLKKELFEMLTDLHNEVQNRRKSTKYSV